MSALEWAVAIFALIGVVFTVLVIIGVVLYILAMTGAVE